jgi:hypothetical protein
MMAHRFTPRHADTEVRLELELDDANNEAWKQLQRDRVPGMVQDTSGQRWSVRAASCGLRCYCDAIAREAAL